MNRRKFFKKGFKGLFGVLVSGGLLSLVKKQANARTVPMPKFRQGDLKGGCYVAKDNTPEQLKALAEVGYFPGKSGFMERRVIGIKVDGALIPSDSSLAYTWHCPDAPPEILKLYLSNKDMGRAWYSKVEKKYGRKVILMFAHKDFRPLSEGENCPLVGEIVRKKVKLY